MNYETCQKDSSNCLNHFLSINHHLRISRMMRMKKFSCCCLCSISVLVLVVLLHSVSTSQAYYLPAGGSTARTRTRTSTTLSTSQNDIFKHQKITKKSSISSRLALFASSSQHRLSSSPSSSTTIKTKKENEISLEKNHPRLLVGEEGTTAPGITAVFVTILALTTVPDAATAAADAAATTTAAASASASAALTYSSHYFGMFVSVGILVYERLSIRPYMPQKEEDTISTVNLFYSIIGILMIGSGCMAMMLYDDGGKSSSSSGGGALDHYLHDTTPLFWFKMLCFAILTSASVFNSVTFTRRSLARALGTDIYVAPIGKQLANRMIQTCNIQIACLLVITLIAVGMTHGAGASIIQIIPSSFEGVSWETYALIVCSIFVTFGIKNFFDALMFEENFGYLSNQYDTKVLYQQPQEEQHDQQQQYGGSNTYFYPDSNNSFYNNNNNNEYGNNEYGNYNYYNNDNGNDVWYNNDGNYYSNNYYNNDNDNNLWYKNSDGRISQGYVPQQLRGEGTTDDPTVRGNRVVTKFGGLMKVSDGIMPADENVPVTDRFIDQNQRRDNDRPITRQLQNIDTNTAREGRILYRDLVNPVPEYPSESVIDVTPLQQQPSPPNDLPSF